MKKILSILLIILTFTINNKSFANFKNSFGKLNEEDKKVIKLIDDYFISINTVKSNFIQFNDLDGTMSEGTFYISRPKKLRFEYKVPFKSILITNDKLTIFHDIELDEISNIPTSTTPISFLLYNNQGLEAIDAEIIELKKKNDEVILKTKNKLNDGDDIYIVEYIFDKDIKILKSLNFITEDGQNINLSFFKLEKNIELDKNLFNFKNPRLYKNRK